MEESIGIDGLSYFWKIGEENDRWTFRKNLFNWKIRVPDSQSSLQNIYNKQDKYGYEEKNPEASYIPPSS